VRGVQWEIEKGHVRQASSVGSGRRREVKEETDVQDQRREIGSVGNFSRIVVEARVNRR